MGKPRYLPADTQKNEGLKAAPCPRWGFHLIPDVQPFAKKALFVLCTACSPSRERRAGRELPSLLQDFVNAEAIGGLCRIGELKSPSGAGGDRTNDRPIGQVFRSQNVVIGARQAGAIQGHVAVRKRELQNRLHARPRSVTGLVRVSTLQPSGGVVGRGGKVISDP